MLFIIVLGGFWFRFQGIRDNHSFWSDEAFVATLARDVLQEKRTMSDALYQYGYQRMHFLTTMGSMKVFGFDEFAARIPSVIFGTISIGIVFLLAKSLSNSYGGILASFLMAFSQLNLANDTQAKVYSALTLLFLSVFFLLTQLERMKTNKMNLHILIVIVSSLASMFHYLGIIIWIPYILYLLLTNQSSIFIILKKPAYLAGSVVIFFVLFYLLHLGTILGYFFQGDSLKLFLFPVNNITYFREIFWRNYSFITLPAVIGMLIGVYNKKYVWSISLFVFLLFYSYLWIFKQSTHNIRYIVPLFGIIFTYFGVFWGNAVEKLFPKAQPLIIIFLILLIYGGGYKIVRKPSLYYSPNTDIYGDVQNADYKTFFSALKAKYPDLTDVVVFTDWGDTQRWYVPKKPIDAYFMKRFINEKPEPNIIDNVMMYGTLEQFLAEKEKYPKGLLVVEDWISFLPDDIKEYAKMNMKLELRVENMEVSPTDKWPLELYSWGME